MGVSTHPVTFHTHVTFEPRKAIVALKKLGEDTQVIEGQEAEMEGSGDHEWKGGCQELGGSRGSRGREWGRGDREAGGGRMGVLGSRGTLLTFSPL